MSLSRLLTPPGVLSFPLIGWGPTIRFLRNPIEFLESQILEFGPVFKTRLLNGKTIIAASYQSSWEILCGPYSSAFSAKAGYGEFLNDLLPQPNLLLGGDEGGETYQGLLKQFGMALSKEAVAGYTEVIEGVVERFVGELKRKMDGREEGEEFFVYPFWKKVAVETMRLLIFGEEGWNKELQKDVGFVFQGMCSIPINIKFAGGYIHSGYGRGIEASERLYKHFIKLIDYHLLHLNELDNNNTSPTIFTNLISTTLSENPNQKVKHALASHLILLSSSLIPKTLASLITSLTYYRPFHPNIPLPHLILECLRLRPPLLGGMRATLPARTHAPLASYHVPPKCRVWYSAPSANCDPTKYPDPYSFKPERWTKNVDDPSSLHNQCPFRVKRMRGVPDCEEKNPYHMAFGAGERMCLGRELAVRWTEIAMRIFEREIEWKVHERKVKWRWMPVLRPVDGLGIVVKKKKER